MCSKTNGDVNAFIARDEQLHHRKIKVDLDTEQVSQIIDALDSLVSKFSTDFLRNHGRLPSQAECLYSLYPDKISVSHFTQGHFSELIPTVEPITIRQLTGGEIITAQSLMRRSPLERSDRKDPPKRVKHSN